MLQQEQLLQIFGMKMILEKNVVVDALKKARGGAKQRTFTQSWDPSIALKDLDMKKPESKISEDFVLPNGPGKDLKVAVISDTITTKVTGVADSVITKDQLATIGQNKKGLKKIAADTDFFLSEREVSLCDPTGSRTLL